MSQTFRIGPARLLTAPTFDSPVSDWTDFGLSRGNAVVTLTNTDIAKGRTDQTGITPTTNLFQTPAPMEVRFLMTDRDVAKLVEAFPQSTQLTSGAKTALGINTTPARITTQAFVLVPEEDYTSDAIFMTSDLAVWFKSAYLTVDSIPVASPIEDTDDALSATAFEVTVVRMIDSSSGMGSPFATGENFQGLLFAYQPSLDAITPMIGEGAGTFTRATTATYIDSNGVIQTATSGTPRYQDGGILLEPQRTNLVLRSAELNTAWTPLQSSISANSIVAPDGTLSAEKLVEDGTTNSHRVLQSVTVASGSAYTFSIFLKAGERTWARLYDGNSGAGAYFELTLGLVGTVAGGTSASVTAFGNGWVRCSITWTTAGTSAQPQVWTAMSDTLGTYLGNGTSGIYVWGAQMELGSYPTSYIPTSGSTATRNADTIPFPFTRTPIDSTYFIRFKILAPPSVITSGNLIQSSNSNTTGSNEWRFAFNVLSGGQVRFFAEAENDASNIEASHDANYTESISTDRVGQVSVTDSKLSIWNNAETAKIDSVAISLDPTWILTDSNLNLVAVSPVVFEAVVIVKGLLTPAQARLFLR